MKIAIIGTHFSGKTTLLNSIHNYLAKEGKTIATIGELVRDCPFPINEDATIETQDWILSEQIKREEQLEKISNILLCDRGIIDNFAYWLRVAKEAKLPQSRVDRTLEEVLSHTTTYDLIFFLKPFDQEIEDDGCRSTNEEFREQVYKNLIDLVKKYQEKHSDQNIHIIDGTPGERFERAVRIIKNL